jgi:hypothetical protein
MRESKPPPLVLTSEHVASLLRSLGLTLCLTSLIACAGEPELSQGGQAGETAPAIVPPPVAPRRVTVPPDELQPSPQIGPPVTVPEGEPLPQLPPPPRAPVVDPSIQLDREGSLRTRPGAAPRGGVAEPFPSPVINVVGITANANPPDTVGDVGRNHYVQMVNATQFQIFNKTGVPVFGPATFGNLWPVGDPCRRNDGDPIVVYDHLADRWLLSQFRNGAPPGANDGVFLMCIAISQTPNPTAGTWFLYNFNTGVLPDYPKFGVWPDGYYMSTHESPNLGVYVFDRGNMLLGNPATFMKRTIAALGAPGVRNTRILPADLDGPAPAEGTPNFFVRTVDGQQDPGNPNDRIEIYSAAADFATSTFTFTLVTTLFPVAFQTMLCDRNGGGADEPVRDCIPQPDTGATVDALSNRPMMQLKYRRFGAHQAMVFNQTIDAAGSMPIPVVNEVAGIRWYELRNFGQGWTIFQQSTYAPQPAGVNSENQLLHRWMGSMAMDRDGNIALAYSITNDDDNNEVFPGIRYAGRRFNDSLGILPQREHTIFNGTNSQTGDFGQRWGDYSALSVDPRDDCTFWFTTHVAGAGGTGPRPTRIASFRFDNCPTATAMLTVRKILVHPDHHHFRLFDLQIDGITVRANVNAGSTGPHMVSPGNHTVGEIIHQGAFGTFFGGDCAENGTVSLAMGESKTCTITNFDNTGGCPITSGLCCEPGFGMQGCLQCGNPGCP